MAPKMTCTKIKIKNEFFYLFLLMFNLVSGLKENSKSGEKIRSPC